MSSVGIMKKSNKLYWKKAAKQEEVKMLIKLKELVPSMSPDKKLSKFEIIQNVIEYINDLQSQLEFSESHLLLSNHHALGLL